MNWYGQLTYEEYKGLESQMKAFKETSHRSETGYYHQSIRLRISVDMTIDFHGPIVMAAEQLEDIQNEDV